MALITHVSTHFKIFFGQDAPEHPYNMYHNIVCSSYPFPSPTTWIGPIDGLWQNSCQIS